MASETHKHVNWLPMSLRTVLAICQKAEPLKKHSQETIGVKNMWSWSLRYLRWSLCAANQSAYSIAYRYNMYIISHIFFAKNMKLTSPTLVILHE